MQGYASSLNAFRAKHTNFNCISEKALSQNQCWMAGSIRPVFVKEAIYQEEIDRHYFNLYSKYQ